MANHSSIIDDGAKIQIIPSTRKIAVPTSHKVIGTVGEHNSEKLTFQCPKTIDGHDIANCSDKYISWTNAAGDEGSYDITDIESDDENIYFPWVVDQAVTVAAGAVSFSVHFEDKTEDGELLYRWGTTACKDCQILDTQNHRGAAVIVPAGYVKPAGTVGIVDNGTHTVAGYEFAYVNVLPPEVKLQEKSITSNGTKEPDTGYHGFSKVNVNVQPHLKEITVTSNGEYLPSDGYDGFSKVTVAIPVYDGTITIRNGILIDFTIGPKTYSAIKGQTWGEWVASVDNYETPAYYIDYSSENGLIGKGYTYVIDSDGNYVDSYMVIKEDGNYTLKRIEGYE